MKRDAPPEKPGTARLEEAPDWSLRLEQAALHGSELTTEEMAAADDFYSDPDSQQAVHLATRLSTHVDAWRQQGLAPVKNLGLPSRPRLAELPPPSGPPQTARGSQRLWRAAGLGLAVIAVIGVGVITYPWHRIVETGSEAQPFQTAAAESRLITLSDGSAVTLGALTQLSVRYGKDRRWIDLDQGEALFKVAHDPNRPFTVRAGHGTVTALGTQFDVRRAEDRVTVSVTEGSVFVESESRPSAQEPKGAAPVVKWEPVRLEHGQAVTYDQAHDRGEIEPASPSAAEWQAGRFGYRDVPLKYVLADVNRYRTKPIVLKDAAAGEYGFTGTVFLDHTAEWLRFLEKYRPLRVIQEDDGGISIESRPE